MLTKTRNEELKDKNVDRLMKFILKAHSFS